MIESEFKELADKNNCEYNVVNYQVDGTLGSKLPISIYSINLPHNATEIKVSFEFGNSNMAEFEFEITSQNLIPEIKLTTRNHFSRIFVSKQKMWKINCKNSVFKKSLIETLKTTGLTEIGESEAFEPIIEGKNINGVYKFNTKYYLGFNEKEKSLKTVVDFHKKMIDHLKANYCSQ